MSVLSLVFCGCGSRARTYATIAAEMTDRYSVVAGADPVAERVEVVRQKAKGAFQGFASADALFAAGKLGDVCVIGTQDALHRAHAIRAMELGYDLLLEKPIAPTLEDVEAVASAAKRLGRRVVVCHVLRYTPFYAEVQRIL